MLYTKLVDESSVNKLSSLSVLICLPLFRMFNAFILSRSFRLIEIIGFFLSANELNVISEFLSNEQQFAY